VAVTTHILYPQSPHLRALECLKEPMLTYGSLFTGIGGIDLGFNWAGLRCQWQVEINDFCQRVLNKNFPGVERFRDVRKTGKHNLKPVDIVAGGFPCQPHSYAGKRKGAADDRNLWPEYRRIVAELKPAYVIGENVPGIRTTILDDVLSDLEDLDYTCQTFVIPACAHNAPHKRDRVWVVAYANRQQAHQQLQQPSRFSGQPGQSLEAGQEALRPANGKTSNNHNTRFCEILADPDSTRKSQPQGRIEEQWGWAGNGSQTLPHTNGKRRARSATQPQQTRRQRIEGRSWWEAEPGICRVVDGFPGRVDRLKSLGNAVVPQQAYFIAQLVARHSNKSLVANC